MSPRRSLKAGRLALLLAFVWSGHARAQSSSDGVAAQALFDEARQLMAGSKYREACPKLEESQRLDPGSGTLLNLADCYERDGRLATAWNKFLESASSARSGRNTDREKVARERAAALAPRLAKIVIAVSVATPGLEVRRDGKLIGPAQWSVPIPADPGEHVVTAAAPGRRPWQLKIKLEDHAVTATASVPELESAAAKAHEAPPEARPLPEKPAATALPSPPSPADAPVAKEAPPSVGGNLKVLGFVVGGVGVAAVGVGTVFGARAISYKATRDKHCFPQGCDPTGISSDSDGRAAANVSTIAIGVGLAAIGVGTILVLTSKSTAVSPPSAAWLAPSVGPGGGGLAVGGLW